LASIAEVRVGGIRYLAVKDSTGKKILRWIGRDYSVQDIRRACRDFGIDLSKRRRRRERRVHK